MNTGAPLYVGLMSGTSVDAIDSALVRCLPEGVNLLATHQHDIPAHIKEKIAAISHPGTDEIERAGSLDRALGRLFADATMQLLKKANTLPAQVRAIGSHGQTIRHRPPSSIGGGKDCFTLQIGDPNTIAEQTGITTVADFRRRDIAAGGEGAPLAPAFHAAAFAKAGVNRAIVNVGGIANASFLEGVELRMGFDTGPGNTLMDHWVKRHRGEAYDLDGRWSATGKSHPGLLDRLFRHPYFRKSGPRSTGKEEFNLRWLDSQLGELGEINPVDVQATLVEFTSQSIVTAICDCPFAISEIYICGGGCHNADLMRRLAARLAPASVASTSVLGIHPDWVEAATFAWLASRTMEALPGNSPAVTGAIGERVLGGIYPGLNR
ncbi:MAG: anhydro-N-acetylmuramic acid kinase [Halioglobus sp.]